MHRCRLVQCMRSEIGWSRQTINIIFWNSPCYYSRSVHPPTVHSEYSVIWVIIQNRHLTNYEWVKEQLWGSQSLAGQADDRWTGGRMGQINGCSDTLHCDCILIRIPSWCCRSSRVTLHHLDRSIDWSTDRPVAAIDPSMNGDYTTPAISNFDM